MIRLQVKKTLNFAKGKAMLAIDTTIAEGAFIAISGPSGSGKTTFLRLIAGLTDSAEGIIQIKGTTWLDTNKQINLSPQKRSIGFVFQNYALFPNMTVRQNISYALEKGQSNEIVEELIEAMELQTLTNKKPSLLSGGQQQRVALARALVRKPQLLLLDEPLSALDHEMRSRLQDYILQLHRRYQLTTILVSHDLKEMAKMADKVIVLEEGKIVKKGNPLEVFAQEGINRKYQLKGEVFGITSTGFQVKIGENIIPLVVAKEEIATLAVGDKVALVYNASKPNLLKF